MAKLFEFGEHLPEYPVPVLNEREVRAGAGIMFLVAIVAFFQAFQMGNFTPMRLVVLAFLIEFAIRVLVNPRYAPALVLGRLVVRHQEPEYSGAPQKRFAWSLGLGLALAVSVMVFGLNMAGPAVLAACLICLSLLFMETAFGICVGCKMYNMVFPGQAKLCPGGACSLPGRNPSTNVTAGHLAVMVAVIALVALAAPVIARMDPPERPGLRTAATAR
ncbi:DUF4395 domain-containing protein [Plastorhodobacter daqingensis]|uniref:DUF4395 domain-containing protein n=1 Tax=Plastorhodobacter daqingensis TaxID=1387281 RepID=A0ABW2UK49_9RHOB